MLYNTLNDDTGGKDMLFRNKIPRSCVYCIHSTKLSEDTLLCIRKGVVQAESKCLKFKYDPCKRTPRKAKAQGFDKFTEDDFKL